MNFITEKMIVTLANEVIQRTGIDCSSTPTAIERDFHSSHKWGCGNHFLNKLLKWQVNKSLEEPWSNMNKSSVIYRLLTYKNQSCISPVLMMP